EEMKAATPSKRIAPTEYADRREQIARFYLTYARRANNWDLVDLSAGYILGAWLLQPCADGTYPDRRILDDLAGSTNLWEQRIAIISTSALIRAGQYEDTLRIADKLLGHSHNLIHKAVGWMLREVGKKDIALLRRYLSDRYSRMPRTALRYAIERMDSSERREWLLR
ncbi:MAG: DNA alkylation repair protein, partial [Bacteroidales bacterium]|nr:DNA alkylation repair protein [Bacteroidales bacterium]